jgi:hypothetical protein
MTTKGTGSHLENWLESNIATIINSGETIKDAFVLSGDIRIDPRAVKSGYTFTNRHDIRPKIVFFTEDKANRLHLGIAEYSKKSVGLTTLGALQVFARIADPKYAVMFCENSLSKELLQLQADPEISGRLFNFAPGKKIAISDVIL